MNDDFDAVFGGGGRGWAQRVSEPRPAAPDPEPVFDSSAKAEAYKPYGFAPTEDLESCDITWWLAGDVPQGQEIQYRFLVRIAYVGDEQLNLMMTDCIISIEGQHLRDLRKRLTRGKVTFIRAYNARLWPKPPEGEPIVEKISILYPGE
jgi:hypothetical protein